MHPLDYHSSKTEILKLLYLLQHLCWQDKGVPLSKLFWLKNPFQARAMY